MTCVTSAAESAAVYTRVEAHTPGDLPRIRWRRRIARDRSLALVETPMSDFRGTGCLSDDESEEQYQEQRESLQLFSTFHWRIREGEGEDPHPPTTRLP
jgi:hypothetical protein